MELAPELPVWQAPVESGICDIFATVVTTAVPPELQILPNTIPRTPRGKCTYSVRISRYAVIDTLCSEQDACHCTEKSRV